MITTISSARWLQLCIVAVTLILILRACAG